MALPEAFAAYLRDFAAGRYFEAHEDLEGLWWARDSDPFLQGLILVAAAHVQLRRGNPRGAERHFRAAARYLAPYAPSDRGVDVAAVVAHAQGAAAALAAGAPPESIRAFRFRLLPGADEAWLAHGPGPGSSEPAPDLSAAVACAIEERRAAGLPVGPASWGAVVKEVSLRTGGRIARATVRAAVRAALAAGPEAGSAGAAGPGGDAGRGP